MFDSISREGSLSPINGFTSLLASMVVHAFVIGLMVIVPLFFIKGLPLEHLIYVNVPPPMPVLKIPSPSPPSPDKPAGLPSGGATVFRTNIKPTGMQTPDKIPIGIPAPQDEISILIGMSGDSDLFVGEGPTFGTGIPWTFGNSDPPPTPEPPKRPTPVRIGTLEPSKILLKVNPVYPRLAYITRTEGEVRLEVVIDEEGNVADIKVVSGHQLLIDAAVNAIKQWKYTPTIQNGEPVPILATIKVNFELR